MQRGDLEFFKTWFSDYTKSYLSREKEKPQFITLKIDHTAEVCKNMAAIAEEEAIGPEKKIIAEAIALFHDIGRFPQFERYRTFRDSISVNHGKLGSEVLEARGMLERLSETERQLILSSVRFHNTFTMPELENPDLTFFLKMIRDADKLDIWRIFLDLYEKGATGMAAEAGQDFPEKPEVSEEVIAKIQGRQLVPISALKTMNDYRIMQLSWFYDLNFRSSFKLAAERDYIRRIKAFLPGTEKVTGILESVCNFIRYKIGDAAMTGR